MDYFTGEFSPNLTEGNRLSLPKRVRDRLGEDGVILTRGFDGCIFGYRRDAWYQKAYQQAEQPADDSRARKLKRYIFSGAADLSVDKQGRVVIPNNLLEYAEIGEITSVVGVGDHFEIWNRQKWEGQLVKISEEVDKDE